MASAPLVGEDEEVFEVHPRPGEEGRVVVEEEREADDALAARSVVLGDQRLAVPARAEEVIGELRRRPHVSVLELLVARERADEGVKGGHVRRGARPDHEPPRAPAL